MKELAAQNTYLFAEFELDPLRRVLFREGRPIALNPKAVEVLLALVERPAQVLSKDDLLKTVWPAQIVEENNLTVHISALRKALGEQKGAARFIVTIPGRGYSFVADVKHRDLEDLCVVEHRRLPQITVVDNDAERAASEPVRVSAKPLRLIASVPVVKTRLFASRVGVATAIVLFLVAGALLAYQQILSRKETARFERFDVRRQTTSGRVLAAVISPGGQYVAFAQVEADGQSLWVRHVPTGARKCIVDSKPVEYWGLAFTPDDNYIYATTFEKSTADPVLSKVSVFGGVVERLPVVTNTAVSFSPDGRRIAYVVSSSSSGGSILWTANVDGSDKKFVARRKDPNFFAMEGNTVAWSPDGEKIACAVMNNTDDAFYMSVVAYDPLDGKETPFTAERWNIVNGVAWASLDGGLVLSGNTKPGLPSQVWLVKLGDNEARRLTNDLNNYGGVSVTGDGTALVAVQTDTTSSIWTGQVRSDLKATDFRQDFSEVGEIPSIGWSADGQLGYLSVASAAPELWMLEATGGHVRQLTVNGHVSDFAFCLDGRYIILVSNRAGKPNLWRIDADGGNPKQLTSGDGEVRPRCASDGQHVFFLKGFGQVNSSVWRVSIDGTELRQVTKPHQSFPDVSPDARQIVYSYMDTSATGAGQWRLGIAGVEEGRQLASFALPTSVSNRLTRWTADGRGLIFIKTPGGVSNLWLQPLDGGRATQLTDFSSHRIDAFDLSRDGRLLAVVRSVKTSDVVLLNDRR